MSFWTDETRVNADAPFSSSEISVPRKDMDYSTKKISDNLVQEVLEAIQNIRGWGSVEIQVQDFKVVQITERNIKKTSPISIVNKQQTKRKSGISKSISR